MRIVIVGAGNAGSNLVKRLCEMGHDVIVIDNRAEALADLDSEFDVMTILGNGSSPKALADAEIEKADLIAAVTSRDEINILACAYAKRAGVAHTICRISDRSYRSSPLITLRDFGVDHALSHKLKGAQEIFNVLQLPGTLEATYLLGGKVAALGIKLPPDSPLVGKPLSKFKKEKWFNKIRFIGYTRKGHLETPTGESQFSDGDEVYVVLAPGDMRGFLDWTLNSANVGFKKIIIAGAGQLGLALAELLEGTSMDVVLVDNQRARAENASKILNKCLVINADIAKAATLKEIGVDAKTAFASTTHDEELNIVSCLHAKQLGAGFTVARIDKPEYVPLIDNLALLDRVVSPYLSLVKAILQFVRGENVRDVDIFQRIQGELQEVLIQNSSVHVGKPLSKLNLPPNVIIAAVRRADDSVTVPTGDFKLKANDRLAVFCQPETAEKLESVFN